MNRKGLVGVVKFSLIATALIIISLFIINFVLPSIAISPILASVWTVDENALPKTDFAPEESVYILGSGFLPNSNISVEVTRPNSVVDLGYSDANEEGWFVYEYILDGIWGDYNVSVSDGFSSVMINFTDHPGAIWTTKNDCGDINQDVNHYDLGDHVYVNGDGFNPNNYDWRIYGLGGSCDPGATVAYGTKQVNSSGNFCFDAYTVQGDCGVYKVEFGDKKDNYQVDDFCSNWTTQNLCQQKSCQWCGECQWPTSPTKTSAGKCVVPGADCGWHCEAGVCGATCDKDSDCSCPIDGCQGNDYYDYPAYGTCKDCTKACYCNVNTSIGKPCAPIVTLNDIRCVPLQNHSECSNGQCIEVNGTGSNQCSINSDCYHSECDYVSRICKQVNAWPDVQDQCTEFSNCIHKGCVGESCVIIDAPGIDTCQNSEECLTPTHSECSNGQCIQVQGQGDNQCSIASDCYHKECNFGLQQCVLVNAWPDVADTCTSNEQCTVCLPDIVLDKKATPNAFSICQNTTITLNVTGIGCPQTVHFPIDLMFVIDRTGSMDDDCHCADGTPSNFGTCTPAQGYPYSPAYPCKINDAKNAAKFFVDLMNPSIDRSGLASFNNTATLDQTLTFNQTAVKSAIDSLKTGGNTAIGSGINVANNHLISNGRANVSRVEILLTNGQENQGSDPVARANEAKAAGIIIYTIALGSDANAALLQQIANITGGKYYFAPNGTVLQQIYLNISQEVLNIAGKNVVVKDVIPSYANYADVLSSNPADNCTYSAGTKTITCNLGNVLIGQSYIITFNEQVNQSGNNILTNVYPASNVTFTDYNNTQQTRIFPQTYVNVTACDDGIFCNGVETCLVGQCQQGTPLNCSTLSGQCKIGECNENFKNCTVSFKPLSTPCNDGLWCSATDHCDGQGNCVQLTPRDCTGFNLLKIETCDNNPDSYHFTWDFRNLFTSICNETSDSCTSGNDTITHICSVANCTAECDATHSCDNKCVDQVWYHGGSCNLTTCNCSYTTQNCDLQDGCYVYQTTGCEDRDYFCQVAGCNYTFSNRSTDSYDAYVNYCSADTIRTHRTFHDFSCDGTCKDHTSWVNDSQIQNCSSQDGWYDSGTTQWISETQCTEREQKEQKYRDYTCSPTPTANCTYTNTSTQWLNTTNTRPKPLSTPCDDGLWCSATDHCDGQGNCVQLTPRDCTGFNLSKVETCNWNPDDFASTFDWRNLFTSICNETSDSCTSGNNTIEHFCADADNQDGGPIIPVGNGVRTCTAQCDGFGAECLPYLGQDNYCYVNGQCDASSTACTCSWDKDGYCPEPGTIIDGYCYWGERYCTENGCSLNKTLMGCNDECDPLEGPKDTIGPITTKVNLTRKCNIINVTANVSNCNIVEEAEYFYDECPDKDTRGIPLSALDGSFDETSELVYVYNIDLANTTEILLDGRHNIYIRGKDEFGNWGNCSAIGFDLDIYPPYTAQQEVVPSMACGSNPTITALVCEPLFLNQSFICGAEYFIDNFETANGEGYPMQPMDGIWGDNFCEWVNATIDTSQLNEGTHYIKVHAVDCVCNWGKIDFQPYVWFIKDTIPPVTSKTLIPFESKQHECSAGEITNASLPVEVSLTNGCQFVKSGTQIILSAADQDTPDHEISDHVRIHWIVWYKVNPEDSWTIDQQGVGEDEQNVTITLNKDSYHLIEYWSADNCTNEEQPHHFELDIVDNKVPTITKVEGDPKVSCGPEDPTDCVYFVKDHVTPIDLYCSDQTPHPVDHVNLWYRILLDGQVLQDWTDPTEIGGEAHKQIIFEEDSVHTLQYYCEDALGNSEGTREQPHQQVYKVDSTSPNTTKTYGQPLVTTNGGYPKWINSSTPITLTPVDGGDICHVGVDKTWYKDRVLFGEDQIACYNPQEYCKLQLLENCQYCQNGNYPKECINQQQEYCTEEMGYDPYTEDWYNCVEQESQAHCCGGWDWTLYRNEPIFKSQESCHVLYYFSVDKLGNVENISVNCFFVENTPPVSTKTIGEPKHNCTEDELNYFNGRLLTGQETFTDGCYYVTQNTQVNLTCSDGEPHPVDNVKIYYKIDWKNDEEDPWTEGTWIEDSSFVTFNYNEDSFHRLTWYCVDALGNKEQDHTQLDIVDTQSPTGIKEIGLPKIPCQEGQNQDGSSFFDNVEGGENGWTTSGLWHITDYRSYSPTHSWAYNKESDHNFDTGDTNSGSLISPSIVLGTNSPQLKFWSWEQTECDGNCGYDNREVFVSENGGSTWNKIWEGSTENQWYQVTIDLSAYAGKTIKIKFSFDTGDEIANNYEGWYIDNIEVDGIIEGNCFWVRDHVTPITIDCTDQTPHPVDHEKMCYKISFDVPQTPWLTEQYCTEFGGQMEENWCCVDKTYLPYTLNFTEDSMHDLEYYCEDALGNKNNVDTEYFKVDSTPPVTTIETIGPDYWDGDKHYIDGVTKINLTCTDEQEPCAVGKDNIQYRYRVDGGDWTEWFVYSEPFSFTEESHHELEYYCNDSLGNTELHHIAEFYVDHTPPQTTKTYGDPYYSNDGSEWINSSTTITMSATDGIENHASGVNKTYYRITLVDDRYCSDEWNCNDAQGSGSWNEYITPFTIQSESCHLIEYYSVDHVNKTETVKKQCPYVDNSWPIVNKTVDEPKFPYTTTQPIQYIDSYDIADSMWYVNQSTLITLECTDPQPHPVDNVKIYYKYYNNGQLIQDWTEYESAFTYGEDSYHELYYYCVDALGNKGPTHVELDIVDSQPPITTKIVGEPKVECEDDNIECWYITNTTNITLSCLDQEPHPVDNVKIYYRYYLDGSLIQDWTEYTIPFNLPEYSNHTVEYYCVDALGNAEEIKTEIDRVDNIPPVIIPDPCYNVKSEDKVIIWATITDDKVGIDESTTKAYIECPGRDVEELLLVYNSTTGRYEAEWTVPNIEGVCYVDFAASDLLGSSTYLDDGKFIVIDNTPPTISSVFTGRDWIGLGDKFYVDVEVDDNSVHFEEVCEPLKCFVRIVDNEGKVGYLQGQLEFNQGVLKCAGFVTVNDTFYEAQAQLWVDAIDGSGNMASEKKLEPIGIDNAKMISITGVNESKWFKGGQWINNVVATVDSNKFGEVASEGCSVNINGVSPENTLAPSGNQCLGNIRVPADISDGEKKLKVTAININGKVVSASVNIRIDNTAPEKIIISPVNETYVSTDIPIIINATDSQSGVYNVSFRVSRDSLFDSYDSGWILTTFNGTTWNYTFNASDLIAGEIYEFSSMVCDNAGNCFDPVSHIIIIVDRIPPIWPSSAKLSVTYSPYDKDGTVILGWPEATDKTGIGHYDISINGVMKTATAGTAYTFLNLTDGFYSFSVVPVDKVGNKGSELTGSTTVKRSCAVDETCTSVSTSTSSSGSGGGGGGGSYSGTTTQSPQTTSGTTETGGTATEQTTIQECIPYWSCAAWSTCESGKQTRTCVDTNECIATIKTETQDCKFEITPATSLTGLTGLFALINSPIGYGMIALVAIFTIVAVILKKNFF